MVKRTLFFVTIAVFLSVCGTGLAEGLLQSLPDFKDYHAKRVSSYDRDGGNRDFLSIDKGTVTLAEIEGPGAITHIWSTISTSDPDHLRNLVLRIYWDGEENPSVESPVGDFFGLGHADYYHFHSRPISIGTNKGLNCFWYMPFRKSAKITVTNESDIRVGAYYYYINYQSFEKSPSEVDSYFQNAGYFHAQYNQNMNLEKRQDYRILEVSGRGHYVGCNVSIELNSNGWWGEGDDIIKVDGNAEYSLFGTGSEDYFCGAWCYGDAFYGPYIGCPLRGPHKKTAQWNVYRYHLEDPIPFEKSIEIDIEAIHSNGPNDIPDNYSSVAYWYQKEPHQAFPELPPAGERLPVYKDSVISEPGAIEAETMNIGDKTDDRQIIAQNMSRYKGRWSNNKQMFFMGKDLEEYFTLEFEVEEKGEYFPVLFITKSYDYSIFDVYIDKKKVNKEEIDGYQRVVGRGDRIALNKCRLSKGKHKIKFKVVDKNPFSSGFYIGIDCLRLIESERSKAKK